MKFIKDLLFFEINTTGADVDKDNIIQIAAVLVDKDNLLERANYNTFIRVSYLDSMINEHAKLLGSDYETVRKSPKVYEAIKQFREKFGNDLLLAAHTLGNLLFLKNAFRKAAVKFDYDPHVVELWTLGYIYTLNYGMKKMPTFNTFLDHFRLKIHNPLDALERARLEAEIFRRIIKEV